MNKAVFLDRDGVLIEDVHYLSRVEDVKFLSGIPDAIKQINQLGYLAILITNQSVVARGQCSEENLHKIHEYMLNYLNQAGARLDAIYYCPHHPDFEYNSVSVCDCRKPGTLLVDKAVERFNIDVNQSFFVGDKESDIQCGVNAGLTTVGVKTGYGCVCKTYIPNFHVNDLTEFCSLLNK